MWRLIPVSSRSSREAHFRGYSPLLKVPFGGPQRLPLDCMRSMEFEDGS
jgi:hypothetical protein